MLSLKEAALEPTHTLAGFAALRIGMTKELEYKGSGTDFDSGIDREEWLMSSAFYTEDGKEGQRAARDRGTKSC
jgi:enoyl-CoA hydratase/carnithine racemase